MLLLIALTAALKIADLLNSTLFYKKDARLHAGAYMSDTHYPIFLMTHKHFNS